MEDPIEIISEIVEETNHEFAPRPGGMVDRHRKEKARREAAQKEQEQEDERIEEFAYKAVKVAPLSPQVTNAITYNIAPGTNTQILPMGPYRVKASILLITAESTVILAKDSGAALGGVGFTLPNGVVFPVSSRAQLYAFNPTTQTVQVSVLSEHYSPEQ